MEAEVEMAPAFYIERRKKMVKFTEKGTKKVEDYIEELAAKRKEILDAGKDTASFEIPTLEDFAEDVEDMVDVDGNYSEVWGPTDNTEADHPLELEAGEDFHGLHVFRVAYHETYESTYTVRAYTEEEAKEKLKNAIYEGLEGPEGCIDSGSRIVEQDDSITSPDVE